MHKNRNAQGISIYKTRVAKTNLYCSFQFSKWNSGWSFVFIVCGPFPQSASEVIRCRAVTWVGTVSMLSQPEEESAGNSWHSWQEEIITLWPKAWKTAHLQRTQTPSFITGVRTGCGQCVCEGLCGVKEMGERLNKRGIQKQREARAGLSTKRSLSCCFNN